MHLLRLLPVLLLLAACQPQADSSDSSGKKKPPPQGRAETQSIRNTDAIGYSGSQIADKVDSALDANDQRNEDLEAAEEAAGAE